MRAAPAVAWEDSDSERVPMDVHPEVFVPDARPNEVLEVRFMCSQEKSGYAWEELSWHLRCMHRDRGEASCSARYAVLESSSSPVVWVELVEAFCDVSNSVLLDMLGKFVLEFFFASVGLSASTGLDIGHDVTPGALCLSRSSASPNCVPICERPSVKAERRVSAFSGSWEFAPGTGSRSG